MANTHRPTNHAEQGSALILVVVLSLAVTALCTTMLVASNTEHVIAANDYASERALFASKAGLNYGYRLFKDGLISPRDSGSPFNSHASAISAPLQGAGFTGKIYSLPPGQGQGQLYKIVSTGTFRRGTRTTELVFQIVPDALEYGYMAFNDATLHRHDTSSAGSFLIKSTIFSNNVVTVDKV